jgi:hypothetical protein
MCDAIDKFHQILIDNNLKADPNKTHFFQLKINFLGHTISEKGISPTLKRVEQLKNLPAPTNKQEIMRYAGSWQFYSRYITNLNTRLSIMTRCLADDVPFEWTEEAQKVFEELKQEISTDIMNAIPNTKYPFEIECDASIDGIGSILYQIYPEGNRRIVSCNSRVFNKTERLMATIYRELAAVIFSLQKYEHLIIGSKFPIRIYTDHKAILMLFAKKAAVNQQFHKYQLTMTKFPHLDIYWRKGSLLKWADMMSRAQARGETEKRNYKYNEIPRDIKFYDDRESEITYLIEHEDREIGDQHDSHPILADMTQGTYKLQIYNV